MNEFLDILGNLDGVTQTHRLRDLLPYPFDARLLDETGAS